jgi:hypothetical protein
MGKIAVPERDGRDRIPSLALARDRTGLGTSPSGGRGEKKAFEVVEGPELTRHPGARPIEENDS